MKKKLIFTTAFIFFFCFSMLAQLPGVEEVQNYITLKEQVYKMNIETQTKAICKRTSVEFKGNTLIGSVGFEAPLYYFIEGTVDYYSENCDMVNCAYKAKYLLNENMDEIMVCFYLIMPTCVEGIPVVYFNEFSVQEIDTCE